MAKKTRYDDLQKAKDAGIDLLTNTLWMSGIIGEDVEFVDFDAKLTTLERSNRAITLKLNSQGGCVDTACAIAGRIKQSLNKITIEAHGIVASAAVLILAVGDLRRSSKFTSFMHHDSAVFLVGRVGAVANNLKAIQAAELRFNTWLAEHTKRDASWWSKKESPEYFFDANEALTIGLVDELF
jgi:ATP-dependent protease ClpP protease subunit